MRTFRPLPKTFCPSDTSICTYPSCPCPISFMPFDGGGESIVFKSPNSSIGLIDYYESSAREKYESNYKRIFGK